MRGWCLGSSLLCALGLDYTVDMLKLQAMQADVDDKIALKRNVTEEARLRLFDLVNVMKTDNNL